MYCGDDVAALVADVGSRTAKFGYAGEDCPKVVVPSRIATTSNKMHIDDIPFNTKGVQHFKEQQGMDWQVLEHLWEYAYKELHIESQESPALAANAVDFSLQSKREYMKMLFETFQVPCMYFENDAVLCAFAYGRSTALVVECGATSSRVVPVYDGYVLKNAMELNGVGGDGLTDAFGAFYQQGDFGLSRKDSTWVKEVEKVVRRDVWQEMKHALCHTPGSTYNEQLASAVASSEYVLPDGSVVQIGIERYKVPEVMFDPKGMGRDSNGGLHTLVHRAVEKCDPDIRSMMLNHLVVTGGGSRLQGLKGRLVYEVSKLVPSSYKVRALSMEPLEDKCSVFTGASILASLGSFQQLWISKTDYEEHGAERIVELRYAL